MLAPPPPPLGPPGLPSASRPGPAVGAEVPGPGRRHGAALAPGARAAAAALRPAAPGGARRGRYRPPPLPFPAGGQQPARAGIPEEALLSAPHSFSLASLQ